MLEEKNKENQEILKLEQKDRSPIDKMKTEKTKKINQRKETLMRIPVGIVSGLIIIVWRYLIILFFLINFFYSIFSKKRLRELADLSEIWNTQMYVFGKYMIFESNNRPFPFTPLANSISKYE